MTLIEVSRITGISIGAFVIALALTPALTHILYKYRLGTKIRQHGAPIFSSLHKHKEGTPTMGGILIWGSVFLVLAIAWLLSHLTPNSLAASFNFLSRRETFLPLGIMALAAVVGLVDDIIDIKGWGRHGEGLSMRQRLLIYTGIAAIGAWWFFFKLDWDLLHIPFIGDFNVGVWYIPIFAFIIVASAFSTNQTDGLDGLSGGILMIAFGAYAVIAYTQGFFDLAALCAAVGGALLAFLWFNIHPARFFMGDTGSMSLGVTLGVMAMLTNTMFFLPFIAIIPVIEAVTTLMQLFSKRFLGRKIFLSAPIHHHFQAIGWPETKVTERFWIIAGVTAAFGLVLYFVDFFLL